MNKNLQEYFTFLKDTSSKKPTHRTSSLLPNKGNREEHHLSTVGRNCSSALQSPNAAT